MLQLSPPIKKARQPCPWDRCKKPREEIEKICRENQGLVLDAAIKVGRKFRRMDQHALVSRGQQVLWRCAVGFKPELGWKFSTYAQSAIISAMYQLCEEHGRKINPRRLNAAMDSPGGVTPYEQLATRELEDLRSRVLHRAIEKLSPRERRVLEGRWFEGLTYRVLGAELGVSGGRAEQICKKAMGKLHGKLDRRIRRLATQP